MSADVISRLIYFGDSLTDEGVMHGLTSRNIIVTVPTPDSGYSRSFTNGSVHAETATDLLDVELVSYAVGGARAVGTQTFGNYVDLRVGAQLPPGEIYRDDADPADLAFDINLSGQVGRYLADAGATPPEPDSAAAFFIGLNDYAEFAPTSPETALVEGAALVQAVVQSTIGAAASVVATGVERVLLYTMPSFRFFPLSGLRTEETLVLGDQLVAGHNAGLAAGAALLQSMGAEVGFIDIARMSAEIRADAGTFGLRADLLAQPVLLGTGGNPTLVEQPDGSYRAVFPPNPVVAGVDPDQLGFWDFVHPTGAVHGIWGVFSADSLDSETFFFGDADDTIRGTAGRDLILAGGGADRIQAASGQDAVLAGLGDDTAVGGAGSDIVAGGSGNDRIAGGRGCDVLADGAGGDLSCGERGSDLLIDGTGFDVLSGGRGNDALVFVDAMLRGGTLAQNGGVMFGGAGFDAAYLILDEDTRSAVAAELRPGAGHQGLASIGLELFGIERVVLLDPEDAVAAIATPAPLEQADLWGLI